MTLRIFLLTLLSVYVSYDHVESFDLNSYRLPSWAHPAMYVLNLDLRWPEKDTFRAYTWIDINVTEEDHYELVLNVDSLAIDLNTSDISVDSAHYICNSFDYSNVTDIMVLNCIYDMWGNNTQYAQLQMSYTAKYVADRAGLFKVPYQIRGINKSFIYSQFESTGFRRVFPSFDEPCFKAPIRLSVDHYENLTVVSNMAALDDSSSLGFISTTFNFTPLISTYLVAVVAGSSADWEHSLVQGSEHFYLFHQRVYDDYISVASQYGPALIEKMGEYTGIKYEDLGNPKMTFAALPEVGGAMENWGLITYGELILVDEGEKTMIQSLIDSITTMAHELSHQWFGDYVTLNWWSEAWLNEGFATYFEWYLSDMLSTEDNDFEFVKLFVPNVLHYAFEADGSLAEPLSSDDSKVNTYEEIGACFSTISYGKGGSFLRMLRYALGGDVFQKGIQEYLKARALDNAKASDLVEHLQAALPKETDIDLSTYLDSWIHQPNYPLVKTSFSEDTDNYLITLEIYKHSTDQEASIWWVPISYTTSDNPDPDKATYTWVEPGKTFQFTISKSDDSWGVVNTRAAGYYRVDYDSQTLRRITNVLNNSESYQNIPTENRAQILDDLFNAAKYYTAGSDGHSRRPYEDALTVAEYLKYETEYSPWLSFSNVAQNMLDIIQDSSAEVKLKADILALIEAQLVIPDPTNTTKVSPSEILKRRLLLGWASKLGHEGALTYSKSEFVKFLEDNKSIDYNYRQVIVCYGVKTSDDPDKGKAAVQDLYDNSILPQEKLDLIVGISCMSSRDSLKRLLVSTLESSPPIDKQYWAKMFEAVVSGSSTGVDAALYFLVNHVDKITIKWRKVINIEKMFSDVANRIVKQEQVKMLEDLLLQNSLQLNVVKAVKAAIGKAKFNVDWREKFGTEVILQRK